MNSSQAWENQGTLSAALELGRLGDDVSQVALTFGWHPGRLL